MVRALKPANAPPDRKLCTMPEREPLQRQRSFYMSICAKKERNDPANTDQGLSTIQPT